MCVLQHHLLNLKFPVTFIILLSSKTEVTLLYVPKVRFVRLYALCDKRFVRLYELFGKIV